MESLIIRNYKSFFDDHKYKTTSEKNKMLINNLIKLFEKKCTKQFYPKWRGNEGDTKVFVLKSLEPLMSKYGKRRENIITIRLRTEQLDIEVFSGEHCNGSGFSYNVNTLGRELSGLYKDINDLFITKIVDE